VEPPPLNPLSGRGRKPARARRDAGRAIHCAQTLARNICRCSHPTRQDCVGASNEPTRSLLRHIYFVKQLERVGRFEGRLDAVEPEALEDWTSYCLVEQPSPGPGRIAMT
jgi:hypothetical protein